MSKYRKVIVAVVGLIILIATEHFGLTQLAGMEDQLVQAVISITTALGVWAVPNETDPTAEAQNVAKAAAKEVLERLQGGRR